MKTVKELNIETLRNLKETISKLELNDIGSLVVIIDGKEDVYGSIKTVKHAIGSFPQIIGVLEIALGWYKQIIARIGDSQIQQRTDFAVITSQKGREVIN